MAYKSTLIARVHILRWLDTPSAYDVNEVVKEFQEARRQAGAPVIGIAIVPLSIPPPEADVRKIWSEKMSELLDYSESLHCVLEGSGFKNSILRSVFTGVMMMSGKRGKISVHKDFDEVIQALKGRLRELNIQPSQVLLAARQRGLLTPLGYRDAPSAPSPTPR